MGFVNVQHLLQHLGLILLSGKIGKDSAAARFAAATPSKDFSIQDSKPYAEVHEFHDVTDELIKH